jgi:histidine triad (HIT) family protein
MSTIFSKIIDKEIPAHILLEDDHFIAFLDVNPLVTGHALVVPKIEVDYLFDLDELHLSGILPFARKVAAAIKQAVPCRKIGVSVVGLEVPHAHVHLIPMQHVDDMNFGKTKMKPGQEELSALADRIRAVMA